MNNSQTPQQRIEGVSTDQLIKNAYDSVVNCVTVPREWLPKNYQGKRKHRSLESVVNQSKRAHRNHWKDQRDVSVKFHNQEVTTATDERLATLERYAANVADDQPITFDVNEDKLYSAELTFCGAMVQAGVMESFDE